MSGILFYRILFQSNFVSKHVFRFFAFFIEPVQLAEDEEGQGHDHGNEGGQDHSGKRNVSDVQGDAAQSGYEHDRSKHHVDAVSVIDMFVDEDAQAADADHSVKQE